MRVLACFWQGMEMLFSVLLVLVLIGCGPAAVSVPIAGEATEFAAAPAATAAPTRTPQPSKTPLPTLTPRPTNTVGPTKTPRPTVTPTPVPEPIVLSGSGDAVVDVAKWEGPALARITYSGSRNFIVYNYGADGEKIDLLVNTIGSYAGTRPLDFLDDEHTARFQVESSGSWEIQVLPLSDIRLETIPGTFTGVADDVVLLTGGTPDLLVVDATRAESNFVIWGYGGRRSLLVNEIAPYDGTVIAGQDTVVLVIEAEGPWQIEVTVR